MFSLMWNRKLKKKDMNINAGLLVAGEGETAGG
jgi:hypothetical protein